MLADDMACNARNPRPGVCMCVWVCGCVCSFGIKLSYLSAATVFNNANQAINVYGDDVEVDYRGYEVGGVMNDGTLPHVSQVTVENLIRVLTGQL